MTTILIVDDDPTICLLLKRSLEQQGYTVEIASNGSEGLEKAHLLVPGLIICDWMMPDMDGLEVCRRIKADPKFSTTFFILLTARTEVEDRIQGLDAGADEFLSKPIDPNELRARVRAGLRLHQLSHDLQQQTARLRAELAEAASYVRSLLPKPAHFPLHQIAIEWCFLPSQELGGDSFNYQWLDEDHLAIYLLDVSGHGVGSALLSVSVVNQLRSQSLPDTDLRQPDAVLRALNQSFQMGSHHDMYFTLWYGVYQPGSRLLSFASAGHPPALLVAQSDPIPLELKTPNLPIGVLPEQDFVRDEVRIPANSCLYVFSDGVYEVSSSEGIWGIENWKSFLGAHACIGVDHVLQHIQSFRGRAALEDDFSLLRISFG
ncbi:PP2C family protein-serine/threonine phosphatase [Synechococcus sp. O70.2]|uniref:PP2C family protein-serine/threonine phosphatase n=1 Tax=Synechococcus sp. O70.2 TaxID=2964533 RepID=UPI0039C2F50B